MPPCTWIAVSQTVRAALAQYAFATAPASSASSGDRASTAHAAYCATLIAPSTRTRASASRCCTAWNEPIATPNWRRSRAYSHVVSSAASMVPTRSATVIDRASARARSSASRSIASPRTSTESPSITTRSIARVRSVAGAACEIGMRTSR